MEVIHFHVQIIKRSKGESAVAAAAYRAGDRLYNTYDNRTHDYTQKQGIVYRKILLPDNAPTIFYDRETLWNAVELKEKSKNSRMAREIDLSLPVELNRAEQINLINEYVQRNFVSRGMCADIVIHDKGTGNPHAHVMLTMRSLDENGYWMIKERKNYILDENGKKIYEPVKKKYICGISIKTNDWDDQGNVEKWRQAWADAWNMVFERNGLERRVTHESYERQCINREPTKHLGHRIKALEQRGILTDRSNENHAIEARNKEREKQKQRQRELVPDRSR